PRPRGVGEGLLQPGSRQRGSVGHQGRLLRLPESHRAEARLGPAPPRTNPLLRHPPRLGSDVEISLNPSPPVKAGAQIQPPLWRVSGDALPYDLDPGLRREDGVG